MIGLRALLSVLVAISVAVLPATAEAIVLSSVDQVTMADRVQAINYCKDTYTITTANGQTRKFWERSLRLKTDSSGDGPEKNAPALVGAGMMGDRADVIFADPSEISPLIASKCE